MSIFIEPGLPTRQGWKKLKIFKADYYNADWNQMEPLPHDNEFFTFTEWEVLPVKITETVNETKKYLA
jgi:hypothetical protein